MKVFTTVVWMVLCLQYIAHANSIPSQSRIRYDDYVMQTNFNQGCNDGFTSFTSFRSHSCMPQKPYHTYMPIRQHHPMYMQTSSQQMMFPNQMMFQNQMMQPHHPQIMHQQYYASPQQSGQFFFDQRISMQPGFGAMNSFSNNAPFQSQFSFRSQMHFPNQFYQVQPLFGQNQFGFGMFEPFGGRREPFSANNVKNKFWFRYYPSKWDGYSIHDYGAKIMNELVSKNIFKQHEVVNIWLSRFSNPKDKYGFIYLSNKVAKERVDQIRISLERAYPDTESENHESNGIKVRLQSDKKNKKFQKNHGYDSTNDETDDSFDSYDSYANDAME